MRPKETLVAAIARTGITRLMRDSEWRRRRLLILCYHGVSTADEHEWNGELYVPPTLLRQRLRYLREHQYNVLPLNEACEKLTKGTLLPRSVAITFDDGARDFASTALPILREFHVPATVYLTTYYSDVRLPVFDVVLPYVLWRGRHVRVDLNSLCDREEPLWAQTPNERANATRILHAFAVARRLDAEDKNSLVANVAARVGVEYNEVLASAVFQIMSPNEVGALPAELVDVQLHTHRHRTPRNRELFMRELRDNASRIRELRNAERLDHFCYPGGDYDGAFLGWLREAGVEYATTTLPGLASPDHNPLLLPRLIDTASRSQHAFEAWASGLADLLPKHRTHRLDRSRFRTCDIGAAIDETQARRVLA
jgi:peptidoglycan/xylan/chitin deacetylase (PgdA/CDA1 family)